MPDPSEPTHFDRDPAQHHGYREGDHHQQHEWRYENAPYIDFDKTHDGRLSKYSLCRLTASTIARSAERARSRPRAPGCVSGIAAISRPTRATTIRRFG